jgi:hypothetical protein
LISEVNICDLASLSTEHPIAAMNHHLCRENRVVRLGDRHRDLRDRVDREFELAFLTGRIEKWPRRSDPKLA